MLKAIKLRPMNSIVQLMPLRPIMFQAASQGHVHENDLLISLQGNLQTW